MTKKLLIFSATFIVSIVALAQWTKPIPKGAELVMGDTYYLYNVGAGGFLVGSNEWNTRASISAEMGYPVIINAVDEDGCVMIQDILPTGIVHALDCQGYDNIWVDGSGRGGYDMWRITKDGDYYIITNDNTNGNFGMSEFTNDGDQGTPRINNRLYMNDPDVYFYYEYEDQFGDFISGSVPFFSGEFYDKWIFVSPAEYEAIFPQLSVYEAAMRLKAAIDNARTEYPNLDFSDPTAVYNNFDATAYELDEAVEMVSNIIKEYKASHATFEDPMDLTDVIGDGSSVDPWIREFTGDGTTGSHDTNTWSTEADGGADGTDMTTPFIEHWTSSGGILSDQKIYQVLTNAMPGLYKLTIDARVYCEAGKLDRFEGISMYFGDKSIDLQEQTPITYSDSKSVLWSSNYFTIVAIVKEVGDVEFGFNIENANFNWLAFKNTSLFYYGNENVEENAMKLIGETTALEKVAEETPANLELIKAYNDAVDAYNNAKTLEEAAAAAEAATIAKAVLDTNIAAYEKLFAKFDEWESYIAENPNRSSDQWDTFCDFMTGEEEVDGYPTPVPTAIKNGNYALYTEDIEPYIAIVSELYTAAVVSSVKEGDDCTDMLVNPNFNEDGIFSTNGWNGYATLGGLSDYMCAERYSTTVDFSQTVVGAPAGLYKIETHAFVRPSNNGEYNGSESINCWLYMNDFRTRVQHILTDALPNDSNAIDQQNCYLSLTAENFWPSDTWSTGYDYLYEGTLPDGRSCATGFFVPNSMVGASYAFRSGRYSVVTYGMVNEGEDMTVGITSDYNQVHWFLFSGFKLTFMGKNAEALAEVLPTYIDKLSAYATENKLSDKLNEEVQTALDAAEQAIQSLDADQMWDALIGINAAHKAAEEYIQGVRDTVDGIYYIFYGQTMTAAVAKGDEDYSGDIIIPEEVEFRGEIYTVTEIGDEAFLECSELTSVDMPKTITTIGASAFNDCTGLTSVTIPESVIHLKSAAFYNTGLTSVVIPESVETMDYGVFARCYNLTSVTLPHNLKAIGREAFCFCTALQSIDVPEGVETIGYWSFASCWSMRTVSLPNSLKELIYGAFSGNSAITDIYCYAENIPSTEEYVFRYIENATLHVPAESIDAYRETSPWADFYQITELGQQNILAINDVRAKVGRTVKVPVEMINTAEITGIEFDLLLPEGITLEGCELSGREMDHTCRFSYNEENGSYKVLILSLSSDPFSGNEGTLLNLVLKVDEAMEDGQYGYGIMNTKLVTPAEKVFRPADTYAPIFISSIMRGDANGDQQVDITDVVSVVNYILQNPSDKFVFAGADVNGDQQVDIVDVVGIVNIILGGGDNAKARDMEVLSNALTMLSEKDDMNILVEGAAKFAAMQFDVAVSGNTTLLDATLNSSSDHQIRFAKIDANRYRVIAFSMDNESFEPTEDALIRLVLNGTATIENATFVAADGRSMVMDITGDATGIVGISSKSQEGFIYNLAGQRMGTSTKSLPTGVYIRNGKRILVK